MANEDPLESLQCGTCGTPDCTWIEYPHNPIYEPDTSAYYQTVRYDQTAFIPFGPSDFYKMWYDFASAGDIAMATSPDGIDWMYNSNMTGLTSTARHSRVLFSRDGFGTNTPYRIWYWDSPNPYITGPEPQMIRTARSVDGVNWPYKILPIINALTYIYAQKRYSGIYPTPHKIYHLRLLSHHGALPNTKWAIFNS